MATQTTEKARQEERFNFRLTRDNKALLERAAALEGKNLKEFIQGAALERARRVLLERSIISMDNEERNAFLALLESDPEPTQKAVEAARQYLEWKSGQAR